LQDTAGTDAIAGAEILEGVRPPQVEESKEQPPEPKGRKKKKGKVKKDEAYKPDASNDRDY
jgi:hypothetical protein